MLGNTTVDTRETSICKSSGHEAQTCRSLHETSGWIANTVACEEASKKKKQENQRKKRKEASKGYALETAQKKKKLKEMLQQEIVQQLRSEKNEKKEKTQTLNPKRRTPPIRRLSCHPFGAASGFLRNTSCTILHEIGAPSSPITPCDLTDLLLWQLFDHLAHDGISWPVDFVF